MPLKPSDVKDINEWRKLSSQDQSWLLFVAMNDACKRIDEHGKRIKIHEVLIAVIAAGTLGASVPSLLSLLGLGA